MILRSWDQTEVIGGTDVWFNKTLTELDSVVPVIDYHWYINKDWTFTNRVEDETRMFRFFTQMQDSSKVNIWGEWVFVTDIMRCLTSIR